MIFLRRFDLFEVLIGLGSNLGNARKFLQGAVTGLACLLQVEQISSLYRTRPVGERQQPYFLNAAVRGSSQEEPSTLLQRLKGLEVALGREPTYRWGPREIDLDLLAFGTVVANEQDLVLPHPRLHQRGFVLFPLMEIAPHWRHPLLEKEIWQLWLDCPEEDGVVWTDGPGWFKDEDALPAVCLHASLPLGEIRSKFSRHGMMVAIMERDCKNSNGSV
jgi:2-amino-4-hydroxy-6-hydroxymethyldihydropteridine diphosphokinase